MRPRLKLTRKWPIDIGATPTQTELTWWWYDQVAQSQRISRITMQANSEGGDMPQYDNSWGSITRSKDSEASERSNDPREGGYAPICNSRDQQLGKKGEWNLWKVRCSQGRGRMPQYATRRSQQLDQKIMRSVKGSMIPGKEGMPQYATRRG